jgi:hypothetical protein
MDRIAILEDFIARAPADPFPRYGLAMELANQGRHEDAVAAFAALVERTPDYLPAYLMYGNTLAACGRTAEAADIYRRGVVLAVSKGDGKTHGELETALAGVS